MKIKMGYDKISKELELYKGLFSQGVQEDMKVVNIMRDGEHLYLVGVNPEIICKTEVEGEYDLSNVDEDWSVAISLKELQDNLNRFRGLQRTVVREVELEILERGVILRVKEEAKDEDVENADYYNETTLFRLSKYKVSNFTKREIEAIKTMSDLELETVDSSDLRRYLEYCHPLMMTHTMPEYLHFKEEGVVAVIGNKYGVRMDNTLPSTFKGVSLSKFVAGFLKDLLGEEDIFEVVRREKTKGVYEMYMKVNGYILRINLVDKTQMVVDGALESNPSSSVELDKYYLIDILKRIDSKEPFAMTVDLESEEPHIEIVTETSKHRIGVKQHTGKETFTIRINGGLLNQLMFSHIKKSSMGEELDSVNIEFEESELYDGRTDAIAITCRDFTEQWYTKYPQAPKIDRPQETTF